MVLDILLRLQLSPLERYLVRRQYRPFVLDTSVSSSQVSSFSDDSPNPEKFSNKKFAENAMPSSN